MQSNGGIGRRPVAPGVLSDRNKLAATKRVATPDSEALASSDDEYEMLKSTHSLASNTSNPNNAQARRSSSGPSWLGEISQSQQQRRQSVTTSKESQPTTPSSDVSAWPGATLNRIGSNPASAGWTPNNTWSSDQRGAGEQFPFPIPLHPNMKTQRSQSYSVGQMEAEAEEKIMQGVQPNLAARSRPQQPLQYRPARPSGLSEVIETALHEEHDDNDSLNGSDAGVPINSGLAALSLGSGVAQIPSAQTSRTEYSNVRMPSHSKPHGAWDHIPSYPNAGLGAQYPHPRRESEVHSLTSNIQQHSTYTDNKASAKWHTSLDFGHFEEPPQSRRHSLAEIPTRRNSITTTEALDLPFASPNESQLSYGAYGPNNAQDDWQRTFESHRDKLQLGRDMEDERAIGE